MNLHNETAAATGSIVATAGPVFQKSVGAFEYPSRPFDAMAFATSLVAQRRRVTPVIARLVCELAQLGGRRA